MPKVNTYSKSEKLKSRKLTARLFAEGETVKAYPFRLHYLLHTEDVPSRIQTGVSVSKRQFKKAVDRNRVKRLMREAYRLQNQKLKTLPIFDSTNIAIMLIYSGKDLPDLSFTMWKVDTLLQKLTQKLVS